MPYSSRVSRRGVTAAHAPASSSTSMVKKLARFRRIGHGITGDRRQGSDGAGWEFVHVVVDDASRLAYVEVLPDEKRQSVAGFLVRALRWFKRQGVLVERVM